MGAASLDLSSVTPWPVLFRRAPQRRRTWLQQRLWRRHIAFALMASLGCAPAPARAEGPASVEQVKAAFILNIARFVKWPQRQTGQPQSNITLCLYRSNPLGPAVSTIQGKRVGDKPLAVTEVESLAQAGSCQILLIDADQLDRYDEEARDGLPGPILTIADLTEQPEVSVSTRWILVNLVRREARIGFDVHLARVRYLGLEMSSELLKLARIIGDQS